MKTHVRTHLRRNKHKKSIVHKHQRKIRFKRRSGPPPPPNITIIPPGEWKKKKRKFSDDFKEGFNEQGYLDQMDQARHRREMARISLEEEDIRLRNEELHKERIDNARKTAKEIEKLQNKLDNDNIEQDVVNQVIEGFIARQTANPFKINPSRDDEEDE